MMTTTEQWFHAAESSDADVLRCIEIDINCTDKKGQTALHVAAAQGHKECCQILLERDIRIYAIDNQGNTALHLAALNNRRDVIQLLYERGARNVELIAMDEEIIGQEKTFGQLCQYIFETVPSKKLEANETPRFQKPWLIDAYIEFRSLLDPHFLHQTAPPNADVITYVLDTFDPRPETGIYISNPLYNPLKLDDIMIFVPTISTADDLAQLLAHCTRLLPLDICNGLWNRTPLHVACDANTTDSHRDIIYYLLNECGCNCLLLDRNGKSPMDLLIQEKNNLLTAPTASKLTEELLITRREEHFDHQIEESRTSVQSMKEWRHGNILDECTQLAYSETPLLWDAYRNIGRCLITYLNWSKFVDPETKNIFYGHAVDNVKEGRQFDRFSWEIPLDDGEINKFEAVLYWCSAKCTILRRLGRWEMLRCNTLGCTLYLHVDTYEVSFAVPEEINWSRILKEASGEERIGFFQEWTVMKDVYGNSFYFNWINNTTSWEAPPDAISCGLRDQLCNAVYAEKNIEQRIFTCDACRAKTKESGKGLNLRICEPCAVRCHRGHKGVRLLRKGFARCACKSCLESIKCSCIASVPSASQVQLQAAANLIHTENLRQDLLDIFMPPVVALVPRRDRGGVPQHESGWMFCRCAPTAATREAADKFCEMNAINIPRQFLRLLDLRDRDVCTAPWVAVRNHVEPVDLRVGDFVLCEMTQTQKQYGTVVSKEKLNTYIIELQPGVTLRLHRTKLELLSNDVFYFDEASGVSQWSTESEAAADDISTPTCGGNEWLDIAYQGELRRYFKDYDEYVNMYSGKVFYIDIDAREKEDAARTIQRLIRQKYFYCYPLRWETIAFSFEKPLAVLSEEKMLGAWAYLRRRSKCIGSFADQLKEQWSEYVDSKTSEYFYWNQKKNEYSWAKPELPAVADDKDILAIGEAVLYRFRVGGPEEECVVIKRRSDDSTGEDMYDVQNRDFKEKINIWVPRIALKRVPVSLEDAALRKLEAKWILQIRRQRAAEERKKNVKKIIKSYAVVDLPSDPINQEETEIARVAAARHQLAVQEKIDDIESEEKRKVEARKLIVKDTLATNVVDITTMSRSDAVLVQRATDLMLQIQEKLAYRKFESLALQEERQAILLKQKEEETYLRRQEEGLSSPRSLQRRKVIRELHRSIRRQLDGLCICDAGCKTWIRFGSDRDEHLLKKCRLRQVYCTLECGLHMIEDKWLAGNYQLKHETEECPNRLVYCPLQCLEWVFAKDVDHHVATMCPKRPGKRLNCRLKCGHVFGGNIEEQLDAEEQRYTHEADECLLRLVRCSWRYGGGKTCGAMIVAKDRDKHRDEHIQATGVFSFRTPGQFMFKVPDKVNCLKLQVWGAGGGSGCFKNRRSGSGGGGAFVEALLMVNPRDILDISIGEGGRAGEFGIDSDDDPSSDNASKCGLARGGHPGGGTGFGGNGCFACGGGGGYTSVSRRTPNGPEIAILAGGGGGGGSLDGVPATGVAGILHGTKMNKLNGGQGSTTAGGIAGESGGVLNSNWPATTGEYYFGGNGSEFGAGGGGGLFGGGGGGTCPGIAGGGGGGSSWVNAFYMKDIVSIGGQDYLPGGMTHNVPDAVGAGDWDKTGGVAGEGGHTVDMEVPRHGNNGAVVILKPGFY